MYMSLNNRNLLFDDGTKTYIKINKENKNNLPTITIMMKGFLEYKLQLVNYRIKVITLKLIV